MSEFADYRPRSAGARGWRAPVTVRPAAAPDARSIAELAAAREGLPVEPLVERTERELAGIRTGEPWILFVAEQHSRVVGFGRARLQEATAESAAEGWPAGWYLMGVIIAPEARRQGVAHALTAARVSWVRERADRLHYFVNARNPASVDLHTPFGFVELTRDFAYTRSGLERGDGILFVLEFGPR